MEFKTLKTDNLALVAALVSREAGGRHHALTNALRRIEIVEDGRYGEGRPDIRLTIALGSGLQAAIDSRWCGRDEDLSTLVDTVEVLVDAARRIFNDRFNTIDMAKEVRSTLSREVAKARRRGLPVRTLDVSLSRSEAGSQDLPTVLVGIEAIGPLLTPERFEFHAESGEEVVEQFADMRDNQERRLALRNELALAGADLMIDAVTLAALEDAGIAPVRAVADLRDNGAQTIDLDVAHGRMPLYVREGVVHGSVPLGDGMHWREGCLMIPKARGLVLKGAAGKPLGRLLSHDYLDGGIAIDRTRESNDVVWLNLQARAVALSLRDRDAA